VKIIRTGAHGPEVTDVQHRLVALGMLIDASELEGEFGSSTEAAVRRFQTQRSIRVDGVVGSETWGHLVEAGYAFGDRTLYLRYPYFRGDDVRELQRKLNALGFDAWREDGIFGEHVDGAVREFQRNIGEQVDGILGPGTFEMLARLRPDTSGPGREVVREAESLRTATGFAGAVIAIDHGPEAETDVGTEVAQPGSMLAAALESVLSAGGGRPQVLEPDTAPSARARQANATGAAAFLALMEGGEGSVSCAYFGTDTTHSPAGQRLASLILERVCERTGLRPGGVHPLAISILRETRMPAVVVELPPGYLAESPAADPDPVDPAAQGIASGVRAFLNTPSEN
jgi:N-acetylmuramoyl-L-alanine amidase